MAYLYKNEDWTIKDIDTVWKYIDKLARTKYGLDYYTPQIEIISADQMIGVCSTIGMPSYYHHWSIGKKVFETEEEYQNGHQGLAYELVVNTNPCIVYLMENNNMTMQTLVLAHAAVGHNNFFKNNYMFKEWSDAENIVTYLKYAKRYIAKCEEKHGAVEVEELLDCAHSLADNSVFRYKRHPKKTKVDQYSEAEWKEKFYNEVFSFITKEKSNPSDPEVDVETQKYYELWEVLGKAPPVFPEENLLYFLEKYSLTLKPWSREILRIVRVIAQYFYPQVHTKVMNEGWASFWHFEIMTDLMKQKKISGGNYLEFLSSHTGVVNQPITQKYHIPINPYWLGFNMFRDLKRICIDPTEEDREFLPNIAGRKDEWVDILKNIAYSYRDDSFIQQFLSPKLIREMGLFSCKYTENDTYGEIDEVHDDLGYDSIRQKLSNQMEFDFRTPNIQIVAAKEGKIILEYCDKYNRTLKKDELEEVLLNFGALYATDRDRVELRQRNFNEEKANDD